MSAVDIALWDLRARRCGVSLARLLGGSTARPLPAYASGGYYRADDDVADRRGRAPRSRRRERGASPITRSRSAGLTVAEDAERVAAAVEAIGGRGRLALDANNAYPTVAEALRAARAFERAAGDVGLWWFEEPLSPDNVAGHAELAATLETPVASGEIHQTRWDFAALIERHAVDILQPDVGVAGGVTEFLRIAHAAETFDIPIAPHWHANLHAQLAGSTPRHADDRIFRARRRHLQLRGAGHRGDAAAGSRRQILLSDRPGIGVELDHDAVARYQLDPHVGTAQRAR